MLSRVKFWHEVSVLHSIITASVCDRFGRPTLYQQGYRMSVRGRIRRNIAQRDERPITRMPDSTNARQHAENTHWCRCLEASLLMLETTCWTRLRLKDDNPKRPLTSDTQESSPGLKVLIVPTKFFQVKSCMFTDELLGRGGPVVAWLKYVWVTKMGKVTL